jgi:hypothetical protein
MIKKKATRSVIVPPCIDTTSFLPPSIGLNSNCCTCLGFLLIDQQYTFNNFHPKVRDDAL